jgi:hypothetical protein
MSAAPEVVGELATVGALLSAASTATDREVGTVYLALARSRLEAAEERARELRMLIEAREQEPVRQRTPAAQPSLAGMEPT